MAWVAMGSPHVVGAVAGEIVVEGRAVVMSASGLHRDLPTAVLAPAGSMNVFVAIVPPDRFPRPTPVSMYTPNDLVTFSQVGQSFGELTSDELMYRIGPSMMEQPVALSGWLLQLHKGGAYTLTAGAYTDSTNIRRNGALVTVAASGLFTYTADSSVAVGYVREWRAGGYLTIVLDQKVG
jgi:hypothetical protein